MDSGELDLYLREEESLRHLRVPSYVVRHLLQNRLGEADLKRIQRLSSTVLPVETFKKGSVVINMSERSAQVWGAKIGLSDLETDWAVEDKDLTLSNY